MPIQFERHFQKPQIVDFMTITCPSYSNSNEQNFTRMGSVLGRFLFRATNGCHVWEFGYRSVIFAMFSKKVYSLRFVFVGATDPPCASSTSNPRVGGNFRIHARLSLFLIQLLNFDDL